MIEPFLWQAVVEEPCFVHHPEIHIGDAPVGPPVAEQQKRNRQPGDDPGEGPGPIVDEDQVFELTCGHSGVSDISEEARTLREAPPAKTNRRAGTTTMKPTHLRLDAAVS